MESDFYKELARLRVYTVNSVLERSKRSRKQVSDSFDSELTRIANSIQKGYTLGGNRLNAMKELYRPYKYVEVTITEIAQPQLDYDHPNIKYQQIFKPTHPSDVKVEIVRGGTRVLITEDNIGKLIAWTKSWRKQKPETLEQCEDEEFYRAWW